MKAAYFEHFSVDEHPFIERCTDWLAQAQHYQFITTPFLNPREQYILRTLANREVYLSLSFDGGYPTSERCRAFLSHESLAMTSTSCYLAFYRVTARQKELLKHNEVLGSILGLGIRHDQIGDLLPHASGCDLITTERIGEFLLSSLHRVGHQSVDVEMIQREGLRVEDRPQVSRSLTVSSLRLDTVLAAVFRVSRSKVSRLIQAGKAKVNWRVATGGSVTEGDVLSLRGFGRATIVENGGMTKKGKYRMLVVYFD